MLSHELDNLFCSGVVSLSDKDRIVLTVSGRQQIENMHESQLLSDLDSLQKQYGTLDQYSFLETVDKQYP